MKTLSLSYNGGGKEDTLFSVRIRKQAPKQSIHPALSLMYVGQ